MVAERERERVPAAYWQALDDATDERDAKQRLGAPVGELDAAGYTTAAKCLAAGLDALVVHLRYPTRHRRRWRSTNLLERSLAEVKRGAKVIGRFPGETSCLTLVWAVLVPPGQPPAPTGALLGPEEAERLGLADADVVRDGAESAAAQAGHREVLEMASTGASRRSVAVWRGWRGISSPCP
jgi:Transposase, Mutator family